MYIETCSLKSCSNLCCMWGQVVTNRSKIKKMYIYNLILVFRIMNISVVELDKKEGLPGKNCYQAKFSTVEIAKLSSLRLKKSPH